MDEIMTYKDFVRNESALFSIRNSFRNSLIFGLSLGKRIENGNNWIRFPYYHHVFDDEKKDFQRQLIYLKNVGDFISMDEACSMLAGKSALTGRYFCLGFDDGFQSCFTNMLDITVSLDIPVIIYLPTDYIGLNIFMEEEKNKILHFYPEAPKLVSFLNWEQCKKMLGCKISFGSHTASHANLINLNDNDIKQELEKSKMMIEKQLGVSCKHFACPWGKPGINFAPKKYCP